MPDPMPPGGSSSEEERRRRRRAEEERRRRRREDAEDAAEDAVEGVAELADAAGGGADLLGGSTSTPGMGGGRGGGRCDGFGFGGGGGRGGGNGCDGCDACDCNLPLLQIALLAPVTPSGRRTAVAGGPRLSTLLRVAAAVLPASAGGVVAAALRVYRRRLTRFTPACPGRPSCSAYALDAITRLGARRGLRAAADRLRACAAPLPGQGTRATASTTTSRPG